MDDTGKINGEEIKDDGRDISRKSSLFYRALFKSSRDAIMTLEPPSWKFTLGNPAALKMFMAKSETEFSSAEPWRLSPEKQPDGRLSGEKAKEMIDIAMRDGTNFFEWTHRRLDGTDFPATVLLTKVDLEGKSFLQATVRDITDIKLAEEKLREDEATLKKVQEVARIGGWTLDFTTNKISGSEGLSRIFGTEEVDRNRDMSEVINKSIHPEDRQMVANSIRNAVEGKGALPVEYRIIRPDNSIRYVLTVPYAPIEKDGRLIKISGIIQDITERKTIELDLRKRLGEISKMNELMVDRELKMIELKKEIKELKEKLSEKML